MTKVQRAVIIDEYCHQIECAVRVDGSSPGREFMQALEAGEWEDRSGGAQESPDEQISDYARLYNRMHYVARHGKPQHKTYVNYLDYGIWEFKGRNKRIAFYGTDGEGSFIPRPKFRSFEESDDDDPEGFWWFPQMDDYLRLLNGWRKVSERADPADILEAKNIAEEDSNHDRNETD